MPLTQYSPLQNIAGLYGGVNRGGPQGAQGVLGNLGGLANGATSYVPPNYSGAVGQAGNTLGEGSNALGIYNGIQRGGVGGYAGAGINGAQLAGRSGLLDQGTSSSLNQGAGELGNALGIYNGIKQGGVSGYGGAAVNAAKLGSSAGAFGSASGAIGQGAGYLAIPLDIYNEIHNWKSGATGSDALAGAQTGAAIGSVIPGIGTVIGGLVGGAAGALSSAFGPGAKDPETYAVQNVIDATSKTNNNPGVAASVHNPYLMLGGLMDRRSSTLPMYSQYGRMGEQKFTNDMVNKINQAVQANPSLKNDPNAVYSQVVAPWVGSMGSGYKNVGPEYSATTQGLLQDMTQQYLSGQAGQDWKAIGGDSPFSNIYQNSPLAGVAQQYQQQQAQQAVNLTSQLAATRANGKRGRFMAHGGGVKEEGDMKNLYKGSFAQRRAHFDDGGSVDYSSYANSPDFSSTNYNLSQTPSLFGPGAAQDPYSLVQTDPTQNPYGTFAGTDYNSLVNGGTGNPQDPTGQLSQYNFNDLNASLAALDPSTLSSLVSGGKSGGILSGILGSSNSLGNWWNKLNTGQQIGSAAGLLSLLSSLGGGNSGGGNMTANYKPTPPTMFQGSGPQATNAYGNFTTAPRQRTDASGVDYAHYGQGPAFNFYAPTGSSSPPASSPLAAGSQMTIQPVLATPHAMAHGGSTNYSPMVVGHALSNPYEVSASGGGPRHIRGAGDGTSDSIPAVLSDGEYVLPAHIVSALGNGSNDAGARKLDEMQDNLRRHVGKQMAEGKQPGRVKKPESYAKGEAA